MSKEHKHITSLFEKFMAYLKEQMNARSRHDFEKKLLDDDFESEALEGFEKFHPDEIEKDLFEISGKIDQRQKSSNFAFWKIAAVVALFITATISIFYFASNFSDQEIVQDTPSQPADPNKELQPKKEIENIGLDTLQLITQNLEENTPITVEKKPEMTSGEKAISESETEFDQVEMDTELEEIPIEKKEIEIPSTEPIKETHLEPVPDKGELSRIAAADVLPTEDEHINDDDLQLPTSIEYDEAIRDKPEKTFEEKPAITKNQQRRSKNATFSSTPAGAPAAEMDKPTANQTTDAFPDIGVDGFKQYLKENLTGKIDDNRVELSLVISEDGEIEEIMVKNNLSRKQRKEIEQVIKEGPMWNPARKRGIPIVQKVELMIEF